MKKWELIILIALCLSIILTSFSSFSGVCAAVREDTLRLHIIANSDTSVDQEAKLYVRDKILQKHGDIFANLKSKQSAVAYAEKELSAVRETALEALQDKGLSYDVSVEEVEMYFPTTEYDDFTMPAGRYNALRIKLGKAEGKNWFCVMFPPLCLPAAQSDDTPVYTAKEKKTIASRYKIKFAVVEWLNAAKESFSD